MNEYGSSQTPLGETSEHITRISSDPTGERIAKSEIAEYFRIKNDSLFLEKMFSDGDDGILTYQQFCSFAVLFSNGEFA